MERTKLHRFDPCCLISLHLCKNDAKNTTRHQQCQEELQLLSGQNHKSNFVILASLHDCKSRISNGTYPNSLKVAEVLLIFKKSGRGKTTNYHPVSLLSQFNEVFKKMLYIRIYSYLIKFRLYSDINLVLEKILPQH